MTRSERALVNVLAQAAIEMPWSDEDLEERLIAWCRQAVQAVITVEVVPAPPPDASFVFGENRYLVARRRFGSEPFSGMDRRVLAALTAMATSSKHAAKRDAHLRRRAVTDDLTGLWQHAYFRELLEGLTESRVDAALGVLFLDVDRFKEINEHVGHLDADEVLRELGARLRYGPFPDDSFAARMGGDEFAVALPRVRDQDHLDSIVAELGEALRAPITIGDRLLSVDVSIGAELSGSADDDPDLVLRAAERRMRATKRGRRDVRPARWYDAGSMLREMLDEQRVAVAYQPIVDVTTGLVHGYEALVRGRHLEVGLVAPPVLVNAASKLRMLDELTELVLADGIDTLQEVARVTGRDVTLSVNLEFEQLRGDSALMESLPARLAGTGVHLVLEISERQVARWTPSERLVADRLAEAGIGLAVDDFGAGYSALGLLNSWPWEWVKIDRTLVSERGGAPGRTLLSHVSRMLDELGMTAVAEGIETPEELAHVRAIGARLGQGTLLASPAAADAVLEGVRRHGLALPHLWG